MIEVFCYRCNNAFSKKNLVVIWEIFDWKKNECEDCNEDESLIPVGTQYDLCNSCHDLFFDFINHHLNKEEKSIVQPERSKREDAGNSDAVL
jgi:hypothetical protein